MEAKFVNSQKKRPMTEKAKASSPLRQWEYLIYQPTAKPIFEVSSDDDDGKLWIRAENKEKALEVYRYYTDCSQEAICEARQFTKDEMLCSYILTDEDEPYEEDYPEGCDEGDYFCGKKILCDLQDWSHGFFPSVGDFVECKIYL